MASLVSVRDAATQPGNAYSSVPPQGEQAEARNKDGLRPHSDSDSFNNHELGR